MGFCPPSYLPFAIGITALAVIYHRIAPNAPSSPETKLVVPTTSSSDLVSRLFSIFTLVQYIAVGSEPSGKLTARVLVANQVPGIRVASLMLMPSKTPTAVIRRSTLAVTLAVDGGIARGPPEVPLTALAAASLFA